MLSFMCLSYKILVESDEPGFPMVVKNENSLDHPCRLIIFMWFLVLAKLQLVNKKTTPGTSVSRDFAL